MHNKFRWHKAIAPIAAFLLVAGAAVYAQEGAQVRQGWPEQIAVQAPAQAAGASMWTGDRLYFGGVPWRVLQTGEKLFLLSEQMLKTDVAFDASPEGASWQDSDLRAFLNGENNAGGEQTLLGTQFSPEEQNAIAVSQVDTEGQVTQDKLFLLSAQEAEMQALGFTGNASRAAQDGTQTEDWWWLRTPGYDGNDAANVYYDGSIDPDGYPTAYAGGGLRPAMYLDCNQIAYSFHASEFGEVAPQEDGWKVFLKGEQTFSAQAATTDGQSVQLKAALPDGYDKIYVVLLDENENKLGVQKAAVQDEETITAAITPETKNILVFAAKGAEDMFGTAVASNGVVLNLNAPAESESTPAESESAPAVSESTPAESESVPAESESVPAVSESTPAASESTPAASESIPAASESIPAAPESVPAQ